MVAECPQVALNSRYSIGEAAKILGIDRGTLRRYADRGSRNGGINYGIRRSNGRRFFTGRDLLTFWNQQF